MGKEAKDIKAIFWKAVEKTDQADREAYLQKACAQDEEARAQVDELIKAHEQANGFLEGSEAASDITHLSPLRVEAPGTVIGRYKLLEKIGEGGMATVFMAEQTQPFHRRVAFKIVKLGMDTKQVITRFEAERQALALMDHPNIAKVYDAGSTSTGRPYFVMELVRGIAITEYCDKNKLSTKKRLGLIVSACQAIQHAHQKGIIHRDIKPTNVLVSLHDGKPVVKVIDFGIAKAVNQRLTEQTLFTRFAQMVGTPQYMSPEQAEFNGLDVDTRTDIYSLGVLLYELLTGSTPLSGEELLSKGYAEMQRIIVEDEPEKPSTKLSVMGEAATEVAERREASPDHLTKLVSGDLDLIVMKSLEKDRTRRYDSAAELAADIDRHFKNEPVLARAPGLLYRMRKFVRRNRVLVISTILLVSVLLATSTISTLMYVEAERARVEEAAMKLKAQEAESKEAEARQEAEREGENAKQGWERAEMELTAGNIERGRLFGLNQNYLGEEIIWREFLRDPNSAHAFWAAWEFYSHNPTLATVSVPVEKITDLALFPDETRLAVSCTEGRILLMDLDTLRVFATLDRDEAVEALSLAPDGNTLAASYASGDICLWDLSSRAVSATLEGHQGTVWQLAHSPDGQRLASAGQDRSARVWDLETRTCVAVLDGQDRAVQGVCFSPDGATLVTVGVDRILLWSDLGAPPRALKSPPHRTAAYPCFSPDGQHLFVGSSDRSIRQYEVPSGRRLARLLPNNGSIRRVWVSADGTILYARGWWRTDRWRRGKSLRLLDPVTEPHPGYGGASSRDDRFLVSTGWKTVRIAETARDPGLRRLGGHAGRVAAVLSRDGKFLASADVRGSVRLWDMKSGEVRQEWTDHQGQVLSLAFSPDGSQLASGGVDGTVRLRDTHTDQSRILAEGAAGGTARGIDISPDGTLVGIACLDDVFRILKIEDGTLVTKIPTGGCDAICLRFLADGHSVAVIPRDRTIRLWDLSGKQLARFDCPEGSQPWTVEVSADGRKLVAGTWRGTVLVFDIPSQHLERVLKGHQGTVWMAGFVPQREDLVVSGAADGTVKLWSLALGRNLVTLEAFGGDTLTIQADPEGRHLIASGAGPDVLIWDLSHFERHMAGNLRYQIEQLEEELGDAIPRKRLLDWADEVLAR